MRYRYVCHPHVAIITVGLLLLLISLSLILLLHYYYCLFISACTYIRILLCAYRSVTHITHMWHYCSLVTPYMWKIYITVPWTYLGRVGGTGSFPSPLYLMFFKQIKNNAWKGKYSPPNCWEFTWNNLKIRLLWSWATPSSPPFGHPHNLFLDTPLYSCVFTGVVRGSLCTYWPPRRCPSVVLMLVQRRRRWTNFKTTLLQRALTVLKSSPTATWTTGISTSRVAIQVYGRT